MTYFHGWSTPGYSATAVLLEPKVRALASLHHVPLGEHNVSLLLIHCEAGSWRPLRDFSLPQAAQVLS